MTGKHEAWRQRVHPEDIARVAQEIADTINGRGEYNTEYRIFWRDGSIHWVSAQGEVPRDGQGRPLRLIGINMGITERKRAEEAMRQSEKRFRLAIRNAPVSVSA